MERQSFSWLALASTYPRSPAPPVLGNVLALDTVSAIAFTGWWPFRQDQLVRPSFINFCCDPEVPYSCKCQRHCESSRFTLKPKRQSDNCYTSCSKDEGDAYPFGFFFGDRRSSKNNFVVVIRPFIHCSSANACRVTGGAPNSRRLFPLSPVAESESTRLLGVAVSCLSGFAFPVLVLSSGYFYTFYVPLFGSINNLLAATRCRNLGRFTATLSASAACNRPEEPMKSLSRLGHFSARSPSEIKSRHLLISK